MVLFLVTGVGEFIVSLKHISSHYFKTFFIVSTNSHWHIIFKIGVLKNFAIFTEKCLCYFRGRKFREQELSRDQKIAKFLTKTFANSNFWDEFRVKNFRENQKTLHLQGKKLSRMATIFFFFFFLFLSSRSLQILKKVQARHEVLQLHFLPFRVRFVICYCVIIFWS